jgi:hypothetical protein
VDESNQVAEPLTLTELADLRAKLTPRADNYEHISRLIATVDKLRDHLPDQAHNEQAIRTLQAQLARAMDQKLVLDDHQVCDERLREAVKAHISITTAMRVGGRTPEKALDTMQAIRTELGL